jgi:hypothetical protein
VPDSTEEGTVPSSADADGSEVVPVSPELPVSNVVAGWVPDSFPGEHVINGKEYLVIRCDGQKVDVIEKGFKNTHRLFLIRSDLEKS